VHLQASGLRASEPRANRVRQRRLFDYLAQEVLAQLPEDFRAFLLRCSVLPQWTVRSCAHVSGDAARAAHWLDLLEQRGLFVTSLDADELTLRPHDLFRDFLQWELARDHPEGLPQLLGRAAEVELDPVARVDYLLRAGVIPEALREIQSVGSSIILAGGDEQLLGLIERFPVAERGAAPQLAFLQGLCARFRYRFDLANECMQRATEGFERNERWSLALLARATLVVGLVAMGNTQKARQLCQAAPVAGVGAPAEFARELAQFVVSAMYGPAPATAIHLLRLVDLSRSWPEALQWLCLHYWQAHAGRLGLRAAMQALLDAMAEAADAHPLMKLMTSLWRAWLQMWGGDVPAVRALLQHVTEEAKWLGQPSSVRVPLQYLIALEKHLSGDDSGAQEIMRAMADEAGRNPGRRTASTWLNFSGAFAAAAGQWATARAVLSSIEQLDETLWPYLGSMSDALRAELALHRHADREARNLLRSRLQTAIDGDNYCAGARVRVALARAELRLTDAAAAWEVLQPLLLEAQASGDVLGLLVCGPAALAELAGGQWHLQADASLLAVLRRCAAEAARLRAGAAQATEPAPHDGTLTERELQVLQRVTQGQSNKVIARELGLSPHTVKRQMARIFDKTGKSSRGQLALWYAHRSV
jgi:LuxR family maltose regulon positive regulatory protein